MKRVKYSVQKYLPKFFHLNEEIDFAFLSFPRAQDFLEKIGIDPTIDHFDEDAPDFESKVSTTVSILFNYFTCSNSNYRIWSEIAL